MQSVEGGVPDEHAPLRPRAQHPIAPAADAHHVEPLALEDDLLHGFSAVVTFALQIIINPHPTHFAL